MILEPRGKPDDEVAPLVPLSPEPRSFAVGEYGVENHQPLNRSFYCNRLTVAIVAFADRGIERFVVDVKHSRPLLRPKGRGRSESLGQELFDEIVHLLPVSDARESRVLAANEHSGMQHHHNQEPGLASGEPERRNRIDAVAVDLPDVPTVWSLSIHHS